MQDWVREHQELQCRHPYSELMPVVHAALADGVLIEEERDDILWLCKQLTSTGYYDQVNADLQHLHTLLGESGYRGRTSWLVFLAG